MSNATAAGPSRGLLDVIFGSGQSPEEADADGQGFGNLMNLIKALNGKKESEEKGAEASWTLRETVNGKGVADSGAAGMPGMSATAPAFFGDQLPVDSQGMDNEQRQRMERLAELGIPMAGMMPQAQGQAVGGVVLPADLVNQALRAKGLPPLSSQEAKLLQHVDGKLAQVGAKQGGEIPPELLAAPGAAALDPQAGSIPKAAVPNGQAPLDPQLQKALAAKGVDPRKLKGADTAALPSGAPEKLMTTETYLQMHDNVNAGATNAAKPPVKELAGKGPQLPEMDSPVARAPQASLTANAVAGSAQKGPNLGFRQGDDSGQLPEGAKQSKLDTLAAGGFGAIHQQASKSDVELRDIYLPGPERPEQMKSALLAEVGSGVTLHAQKGGGEMRLVIHPDDLGEVKLKVGTKNGKVEVQVTAENEDVAKLIRGGSKELEASLKEQNLSLSKFEVTVSDASSVASTDTRSGFNEQFLSQNQQHDGGFTQGNLSDDGRNARWGADQGARQGGGYSAMAEDSGRSAAQSARSIPRAPVRAADSSRRLDVVA